MRHQAVTYKGCLIYIVHGRVHVKMAAAMIEIVCDGEFNDILLDYHKITYSSGRRKTELDLLVVRQQQLRRVKDCKALAGEYVTTQHKPVVFEVRMKKWKEKRTMGPKNIKWWKCKDEMTVEYRERVRRKYEELDAEKGTV